MTNLSRIEVTNAGGSVTMVDGPEIITCPTMPAFGARPCGRAAAPKRMTSRRPGQLFGRPSGSLKSSFTPAGLFAVSGEGGGSWPA